VTQQFAVAERLARRATNSSRTFGQSRYLGQEAVAHLLGVPSVDPSVEQWAFDSQAEHCERDVGVLDQPGTIGRERASRTNRDLEGAEYPSIVVGIYSGSSEWIERLEFAVQGAQVVATAVEVSPHIGEFAWDFEIIDHRAEVQPGATNQNWNPASRGQIGANLSPITLKCRDVVVVARVRDID